MLTAKKPVRQNKGDLMSASQITPDPMLWLMRQFRQAREMIPGATIVDAFEWALISAEYGDGEQQEVEQAVGELLDTRCSYKVKTPDECWWKFVYEPKTDYTGVYWNWWAHRRLPGKDFEFHGKRSELEVLKALTIHGHKLDDDDKEGLFFWLNLDWPKEIDKQLKIWNGSHPLEEEL